MHDGNKFQLFCRFDYTLVEGYLPYAKKYLSIAHGL